MFWDFEHYYSETLLIIARYITGKTVADPEAKMDTSSSSCSFGLVANKTRGLLES